MSTYSRNHETSTFIRPAPSRYRVVALPRYRWLELFAKSQIVIPKEPDIRPNSIKLVVGNVLVAASRYPEYKYGDKLKIAGLLKNPPVFDDFNYRDYLKKDGIISVMNFPKIELLGSGFGNPAMKALLSFKNKFKETTGSFI
ncbi:MAG: hypothetical protein HYU43_03165 [Armatimonadetes bacterium]|nr:hypothetical protein [Armatimonadota bacterium]